MNQNMICIGQFAIGIRKLCQYRFFGSMTRKMTYLPFVAIGFFGVQGWNGYGISDIIPQETIQKPEAG